MRVLPRLLKRRHGRHKKYSEKQVTRAVSDAGLSQRYLGYALAMFVSRREFEALLKTQVVDCDFDDCRQVIGDTFFGGNHKFDIHDTLQTSAGQTGVFGDEFEVGNGLNNDVGSPIPGAGGPTIDQG